ncbi:MAG: ATP-binding protein [Victivallales bacterium]|nr:ATP-binding protein [Victivallales bacterium]
MLFFDREDEIKTLREIRELAKEEAQWTVLTGRRRIGKTELLLNCFSATPFLYLFVTRASEADLCEGYKRQVEAFTGRSIPGKVQHFSEIFRYLMEFSRERSFTLVIDEFQDFLLVNPIIFSEMQREWDMLHRGSKLNLIVCGSIHSIMNKIFLEAKEPLYGRQTEHFTLRPFRLSVLRQILGHYHPKYTNDDLLALWTFTGGVAKYVSLLMDRKAYTVNKMLDAIIRDDSFFLFEGWAVLQNEFGKDYGTYFSILAAIATGSTSRSQIMNQVGTEISGYLTRLETQYRLIAKKQPFAERSATKNVLYKIDDNFYRFWFRFIYKYQYLIQLRMFDELKNIIKRDYECFAGITLEGYFREKFMEAHLYTKMEGWWDRKGENEIDLVCENEFTGTLDIHEVKMDAKRLDTGRLHAKAEAFLKKHPEYRQHTISFKGLSKEDM